MYQLRLFHDEFAPGSGHASTGPAPHTISYVFRGAATVAGTKLDEAGAIYFGEHGPVEAGPDGATIWRWELVDRTAPFGIAVAPGVRSTLKMARDVKMFELVPTSKWLFRLDTIIGFQGTTGMHAHLGSGIRCLLHGHLRAESNKGESSDNREPGDTWYEEGAYPLVSSVDPGIKTTFLRGMVLPPEYLGLHDSPIFLTDSPEAGATVDDWRALAVEVVTLR